jgi:uncharacterized SAM-binding protein YcdF (DUF218 family)
VISLIGLLLLAVPTTMVLLPGDDEPRSPDGILVLGGVGRERIDIGIELSESYDIPLVLSSSATWFANDRGYRRSLGNALCLQRPFAERKAEEAQYTVTFMDEHGWDHTTVVTSSHHTQPGHESTSASASATTPRSSALRGLRRSREWIRAVRGP